MSLIKEALNEDLKNLNLNRNSAFKNPIQMIVANGNKKSVVFPINKLEKPTIDSVLNLNTVPLFYSPITKQLILQQDLEHNNQLQSNRPTNLNTFNTCNSTKNSTLNYTSSRTSSTTVNNKKCETRLSVDKNRPNLDKEKLNNLNNLNDKFTNDCLKEEKKLLETQLDDFTTKSINLSQRPVDNLNDEIVNNCKILNNNHNSPDKSSLIHKSSPTKANLNDSNDLNHLKGTKLNLETDLIKSEDKSVQEQKQTSIKPQIKKDTFKCHRRTPSYIHDFHNLIKNNSSPNQTKSSSITVDSAHAAVKNLTKTSLASLTSTLSSTINSTTKFNDHQMNSTNSILDPKAAQLSAKQIVFNESKNEFYDLDSISDTGTVRIKDNHSKTYSIDDDNIEPLKLPLPYLEKPKKLSFLTEPLQSVLSKLTKSSNHNDLNSSKPVKQADSKISTNFFQAFTQTNSNESSRRNSKNLDLKADLKASTTGLIFENRPLGLQPKNKDEELQHREQYEQMLKEAKRKELKDAKQTKKEEIRKKKEEERMLNSIKLWNEILPQFEQIRNTKKVKELWNQGLPSNLRGQIWKLAIGNKLNLNESSLSEHLSKWYDSKLEQQLDEKSIKNDERIVNCLSKCSDENISELIQDVSRTFPNLKLFQKNAPFHNILLKVLGSYVISYKPNVGYIQGMSFILGKKIIILKYLSCK